MMCSKVLLFLPLTSIQDETYVHTQFACTEQVGETDDHLLTSMQLNYEKDRCGT